MDEPDANGNYTGSYYMYDGKRFGDLREKIMGIYQKNKANKTLKIYEKEALDQYYKDYKKENGNSYIDRYYNRMCTWEIINSQYDNHYLD